MIDQAHMVCPLQTHGQENLITASLMGQAYDGVYDVLGNLPRTPRSAAALFPASVTFISSNSALRCSVWVALCQTERQRGEEEGKEGGGKERCRNGAKESSFGVLTDGSCVCVTVPGRRPRSEFSCGFNLQVGENRISRKVLILTLYSLIYGKGEI